MVGRVVQFLEIFRRVVSLIENQGDVLAFPAEHLVASDQIVQNPAEGDRVVLVALVDLGEERNMKIPGNQPASWRLLVGAKAPFRVARSRYSPTEGPCFRLGAWASMLRSKSSCRARSQRAAVAPKSRPSAHRGRPGAWERSWRSLSAVPR